MAQPAHHEAAAPVDAMPLLDNLAPLPCRDGTRLPVPVRAMALAVLVVFGSLTLALLFLPWQQFISGEGRVVAYHPLDRPVMIEAPLSGRVEQAPIVEGQFVRKGDLLVQMADNDPQLLGNLELQRKAAESRRDAARERVASLSRQIEEQERTVPLALTAASNRLDAARFARRTAELQFERIRALHEDDRGLSSRREFELATLERDRTQADYLQAQALLERTEPDLRSSINASLASRDAARAELAAAEQAIAALTVQINQAGRQRIVAPRDGVVLRLQATEGSFLRAGSPVCTLIPETTNRWVELWVDGNDMPLIRARTTDASGKVLTPGSPVRLQFEGWPAIQFIGWPSVARGTFGGEVVVIDATDNGQGKFRVLVAPDPDEVENDRGEVSEVPWPGNRWLRQGVRANGWVLLEQVPLWYEFWRQMNGFPPSIPPEKVGEGAGK